MSMQTRKRLLAVFFSMLVLSGFGVMQAFGDDDGEAEHEAGEMQGGNLMAKNTAWVAECSTCHIAYPPGVLPASSWREIMRTLDQHFGTDASLDAKAVAEILPFLEQNAGESSARETKAAQAGKPTLRITEMGWFKHEHDEISDIIWKRVNSPSNCVACHTQADKGNFDEDAIKIPKQ